MPKYLSGRQKLRPSDKLTEDRYKYLGLDQAEPNLADPLTSPGVPGGTQYQLIAVAGYDGRRYWVPVGGAVIPGAITVFDENTPVSSASSITQLNFVGAAVTANVSVQSPSGHPGIAATVTVIPVNVGDNPPNTPTPNEGELWWESDTGDLYIYYNDGDSSQWVMANSGGRGLTGDKGEVGEKGVKGDKGELGNTGSQGDKGDKGAPSTVKGDTGDKGDTGEKGATGDKGDEGDKGDTGTKGGNAAITNNSDNRVITGSDTANELNAESKLTFDSDNVIATLNVTGNTNITGITTVSSNFNVNGNSTLQGTTVNTHLDVIGLTTLDDVNVSSGATFAGAIDANGDIDVDGHTNLDNVSIAGVTTFNSDVLFTGTNYDVRWNKSDNELEFKDNARLGFGDNGSGVASDLTIKHNTTVTPHVSQITNRSDSQLEIIADMLELRSGTSDRSYLTANVGAATTIFHSNTARLETTTDGVKIYGGLQDKDGDLGASGQVLTSTGTQLNWVAASTVGGSVNTTYDLSVPSSTTKIRLAGSDSTNDDIEIAGGTNVTVTRDNSNKLTISSTDTDTQLSTEDVQDIVGAMFSSNTETRISATYQDSDGTIDLIVDDMTSDTQLSTEDVQDIVGAMVSSNTETRIAVTYNDSSGKLNFVVDDQSSDNNTTYGISAVDGDNSDEEKIRLTGNDSSTDDVVLEAGTGLSIARSGDKITLTNTDTGSSGSFPSGTRMLFQQTSAPTGWTKVTSGVDNRALRIVTGNVGSGGAEGFTNRLTSTVNMSNGSVDAHTLTSSEIPSHYHLAFRSGNHGQHRNGSPMTANNYPSSGSGAGNLYESYNIGQSGSVSNVGRTSSVGSNSGHSHGFTNPSFNLNIAYTDVIIAQKN